MLQAALAEVVGELEAEYSDQVELLFSGEGKFFTLHRNEKLCPSDI